jgi:hypothetical protein
MRPCLGPQEWKRERTINRATTVLDIWAALVNVADDKVMNLKRRENPDHAHFWVLQINSQSKGMRSKPAYEISQWIGQLSVQIGLSLKQMFVKREITTENILVILDNLWVRAVHIPCNTRSRTAFHMAVVLTGIGGWRPGGGWPEIQTCRDGLCPTSRWAIRAGRQNHHPSDKAKASQGPPRPELQVTCQFST